MFALEQIPDSDKDRFWSLVDIRTPLECWTWKRPIHNPKNAAQFYASGVTAPSTHFSLVFDGRARPSPP
jgi:hypothetical protein